jgi:hypothetical protein
MSNSNEGEDIEEIEEDFAPTQAVAPSSRRVLDLNVDTKTPGSLKKRSFLSSQGGSVWQRKNTKALSSPAILGWSPNVEPQESIPVVLMSQETLEAVVEEKNEDNDKEEEDAEDDIFLATQAVSLSHARFPSTTSTSPSLSLQAPLKVSFSSDIKKIVPSAIKIDRIITSPVSIPRLPLGSIYDIVDNDEDEDEEEDEDAIRLLPTQIQAPTNDIEVDNQDYDVAYEMGESEDAQTQEKRISKRSPKRVRISKDVPHQISAPSSSSRKIQQQRAAIFQEAIPVSINAQMKPVIRLDSPVELINTLTSSWPGTQRKVVIDQLCHLIQTPTSVIAPILFHGRSGSGKTEFLRHLLSLVGCVRAEIDCTEISSFRDFFESILSRLGRSAIQCALECRGGTFESNAAHLMARLCSPERGPAGRACAAALVRWADLPHLGKFLRKAFVDMLIKNFSGQVSTSEDFHSGISEAYISQLIGQAFCSSMIEFAKEIGYLTELCASDVGLDLYPKRIRFEGPKSRISLFLIIDHAERLVAQDPRMASMLTQLGEWSGSCTINVVYITSAPAPVFSSLRECEDRIAPLTIYWAPPTIDTVKAVLLEETSSLNLSNTNATSSLTSTYRSFVLYVIDTFGDNVGYNLGELLYICRVLWPFYSLPVRANVIESDDMLTLRRVSLPFFEHVQRHLLDHDSEPSMASPKAYAAVLAACGPAAVEKLKTFAVSGKSESVIDPVSTPPMITESNVGIGGERSLENELPWFLKFVLVAAFCAGHNSEDTDIRYFSRVSSGRRKAKSSKQFARKKLRDAMSDGPKPFPLERLLALTHALIASHEGIEQSYQVAHADLTSGIALLQGLRLLTRVLPSSSVSLAQAITSGADEIYRCNLTVGAAQIIAKNIGVDIGKYIHDESKGV